MLTDASQWKIKENERLGRYAADLLARWWFRVAIKAFYYQVQQDYRRITLERLAVMLEGD